MKTTFISVLLFALLLVCTLANAQQTNRTIFLVRHAEPSSAAPGATLSMTGEKRAECLAKTLAASDIKQIYVSDSRRAQQTAAPLAAQRKLTPATMPAADISKTVRNLLYGGTGNTLLITNGDMLPLVVQRLQAGKTSPVADTEFDRLFVISVTEGSSAPAATLRYCDAAANAPSVLKHASLPSPARR